MAANGISTLQYKADRQVAKLELAGSKRSGDGRRSNLDLSELPTVYAPGDNDTNHVINNPNDGGLVVGRPWTDTPPNPFTTFKFHGEQNKWTGYGTTNLGAATFSSPAPSYVAYTYPDSSTGYTFNFTGSEWMVSANLASRVEWPSHTITVDYWFYPTANGIQLLSETNIGDVTTSYHYSMLEITSGGYVKARFYDGTALTSANTVDLNAWNHIYFTEDAGGVHTFALNGQFKTSPPTYTRVPPTSTTEYFIIGLSDANNMGSTGRFQGKVGWLEISNYIVASTYNSTKDKFRPTSYSITPNTTSINEGDTVTFTITTTNVPDGTTLYHWAGGNISADRLSGGQGTITINSNTATFTVTVSANQYTDGSGQAFQIVLGLSNLGDQVAITDYVHVADTSQTPVNGLSVNWLGSTSEITPTGSYTSLGNGVVTLAAGSYVNTGHNLPSNNIFSITIDVDLSTGGGGYWNVIWGNDNYGATAGDYGWVAYLSSSTQLFLGSFNGASRTIGLPPGLTGRNVWTFVVAGLNVDFYLNGQQISTGTLSGSAPAIPNNNLFIGARHGNAGVGSTDARGGTYYSVRVKDTTMTSQQVYDEYAAIFATW